MKTLNCYNDAKCLAQCRRCCTFDCCVGRYIFSGVLEVQLSRQTPLLPPSRLPPSHPIRFLTNKDFPEITRRQSDVPIITIPSRVSTNKPVVRTFYKGSVIVKSLLAISFKVISAPFAYFKHAIL